MTDKYKDLRDALESGSLALEHVATAEGGGLRWMTGRKMRNGVASVELHSIPSGRRAHGRIAVEQDTIRALLADHDALIAASQALADWAEEEVGADPELTPGLARVRALAQHQGEKSMAINDGGTAYPLQDPQAIHAYAIARTPEGGTTEERDRAYTEARAEAVGGMSLRDAFAMAALQGLCANPGGPFQQNDRCGWGIVNCTTDQIAEEAYGLADAMIRARTQDASHE